MRFHENRNPTKQLANVFICSTRMASAIYFKCFDTYIHFVAVNIKNIVQIFRYKYNTFDVMRFAVRPVITKLQIHNCFANAEVQI